MSAVIYRDKYDVPGGIKRVPEQGKRDIWRNEDKDVNTFQEHNMQIVKHVTMTVDILEKNFKKTPSRNKMVNRLEEVKKVVYNEDYVANGKIANEVGKMTKSLAKFMGNDLVGALDSINSEVPIRDIFKILKKPESNFGTVSELTSSLSAIDDALIAAGRKNRFLANIGDKKIDKTMPEMRALVDYTKKPSFFNAVRREIVEDKVKEEMLHAVKHVREMLKGGEGVNAIIDFLDNYGDAIKQTYPTAAQKTNNALNIDFTADRQKSFCERAQNYMQHYDWAAQALSDPQKDLIKRGTPTKDEALDIWKSINKKWLGMTGVRKENLPTGSEIDSVQTLEEAEVVNNRLTYAHVRYLSQSGSLKKAVGFSDEEKYLMHSVQLLSVGNEDIFTLERRKRYFEETDDIWEAIRAKVYAMQHGGDKMPYFHGIDDPNFSLT